MSPGEIRGTTNNPCYKDNHNAQQLQEGSICFCEKFKLSKKPGDYFFSWILVDPFSFTEVGSV